MRSKFRCNRGAARIATAEDGVFEDFTVDVGRIGGGSQRYGNGGCANGGRSFGTAGSVSAVGTGGTEGWRSVAVAEPGTADKGGSISSCK